MRQVREDIADEAAVYGILCRNLKHLCQASCAAVASYNPKTNEVLLQAVETDLVEVSNCRPKNSLHAVF